MPVRSYVTCKFRPGDNREYTYHYDGDEPLAPGDRVKVPDRSGDGFRVLAIARILRPDMKPEFETKGVIGKADPEPETDLFGGEGRGEANAE